MFNLLKSKIVSRFMLIFLALVLTGTSLYGTATITATYIPNSIASGGGTGTTGYPFAVYVTISGWTAGANAQAYIKLYSGSNNEFMWSATGVWSNTTTFADANQPKFNIDANGNASGWIYAKHNNSITGPTYNLRAAKVGSTSSTQVTQTGLAFTALTLAGGGNGGWVVRNSSPAVNKAILAYSGSTVVGSYRTEDNGITEGYSFGSGGFQIAVPTGTIDSLVSYNDDGSRDQLFAGPWTVTAGNVTDVSSGGVGSAAILPTFTGVTNQSVTLTVYGQTGNTITNVNVAVPALWTWSQSTGDVSVVSSGGSPTSAVSGDTVQIGGLSVGGTDSVQIILHNITPVDSTDYFTFNVLTGVSPSSMFPLGTNPRILVHGSPRPIGQVQANDANGVNLLLGKYVTIEGVMTVTNQFNGAGYIQDNSDGIAIYDSSLTNHVNIGDKIIVFGLMTQFNGLAEIDPATLLQTVSTGNTVTPLVVTCSQIANDGVGGNENYEGLLVQINVVSLSPPIATWAVSGSGTNYNLTDGTGTVQIRVVPSVNYANQAAPQTPFSVIGVVGQFKSASPFIGGYQLQPRFLSDILTSGPVITNAPAESNITSSSFTVNWSTLNNGTTRVRYGTTTSYELGLIAPDNTLGTSHTVNLSGLQAATIYHIQAFSDDGSGDTSKAGDLVVSTSSPSQTTGQMNVYFNYNVNTSVSLGENAQGNVDLVSKIVTRINNAKYSIDAALYSFSGTSQGDAIANAMVAAKNRGVKVRVVCDHVNGSESGFNILRNNGITLIDQTFDPTWNNQGIMHNKFFVIDYRGGAPDSIWVWGGSWNPTQSGTTGDRQNSIEIQDVALAGAYTTEFNLMWGSNGDTPNSAYSKFGSDKSDIAPHNFIIGGIPVSVYFSPSDKTTSHIAAKMSIAQYSLSGCIDTFTRTDLADTMVVKKNAGKKVREVMDNNTDTGNQYAFLLSSGVDVHLKGFSGALLHHKYMVVDGDHSAGSPYLMTGSHNWSNAAEESNDENEEIIQSSRIANLYLQEFAARYYEAGGTDSIHAVNDGVTAPVFSENKSSINFDTVYVNNAKQDSFVVSNTGNAALTISSVVSNSARYTISPASGSVNPGGTQKFYVTFSPNSIGSVSAKITLTHNGSTSPDSVTLLGFGGSPTLSLDKSSINFDTVFVNSSKPDSFVVSNTGNATLSISSAASSNARYVISPTSASVYAGHSQTFLVTFSPTAAGTLNAKITLTHNGSTSPDSVTLTGFGGLPILTRNKTSINFDTVYVNSSKQDSFMVSNTGSIALNISSAASNNARFTISPTSASIPIGNSQMFFVTYSPTAAGTLNAKITLTHNGLTSPDSVTLTGFGGLPILTRNKTSINFDTVFVNSSKQDSFLVTNTGNVALNIFSAASNNAWYTVSPASALVSAGNSQTFFVTFSPTGAGTLNGKITLTHNGLTSPDSVTLTGFDNLPTITVTQHANGTIAPGTTSVSYGGNQSFTITPAANSHIDSVVVDGLKVDSTTSYTFSNVTANHTITGFYSINTFAITVTQHSNGTIVPGTTVVNYGSTQSFAITPATGYHIDSVIVDGAKVDSSISYTFTNVTANHTMTGYYSINSYTVTVTQQPNGTITPGTTALNYGASQSFVIIPATGYHVDSLIVDGTKVDSTTSYTFTSVNTNHTIRAVFGINTYTITASAGLHGTITPGGSIIVSYGSDTTFTITPDAGYHLDSLIVDSVAHPIALSYSFDTVSSNHSIRTVFASNSITVNVNIATRWNLLSVPVVPSDDTVSNLFPSSTSKAFAYNGNGYEMKNEMKTGTGYWLKFASAATDTMTGLPVTSDSVAVLIGWNLIGSLSSPLPALTITSNTPGMVTSNFFSYNGNYKITDTLYPGKGYWIKVNQAGTLILSTGSSASLPKNASNSRIRIIPTAEMPPLPPNGDGMPGELPKEFALEQNYPNPFNPTTTLRFDLPTDSKVTLKVYNLLGQVVTTLNDGVVGAGYQFAVWNASNAASGIYFYRMEATSLSNPAKTFTQVKKMVLMK